MTTIQIPPSGVPAHFPVNIPAPEGMDTLSGIRMLFTFAQARPDVFVPRLRKGSGEEISTSDGAVGPKSVTRIAQFPAAPAPLAVVLSVNEGGSLEPGNNVTVYTWGAQTQSGEGALNPDEGGEPSTTTDTIEVGTVEVLTWTEWNRLTDESQQEPTGS